MRIKLRILVALVQVEACRVEALEDSLGVILLVKLDVDDHQALDGIAQLIGRQPCLVDTAAEIDVILGYVGVLDELLCVSGVKRLKGSLVVLDELQLQLSLGLMPFVDEVFLVDHVGQIVVFGGDGAFPELAHKRKEKEVRRGDPLLAIDDDACVGAICFGDDASKEMTLHAF